MTWRTVSGYPREDRSHRATGTQRPWGWTWD